MPASPTLIEQFHQGDIRALARLLTLVENKHPEAERILETLFPHAGGTFRIGLTGAPGAGKSTLVSQIVQRYAAKKSVAVLAIDPTSPFTGGALLGDRIRFKGTTEKVAPVFFRSAASRGHTGGLARTTEEMSVVLKAFGFERLLIESVGVGQVGLDIAGACDTTIVVVVPESGDDIQAMKAGLLEIADILVVNKSDRPGANTLREQLVEAIHFRSDKVRGGKPPEIMLTEATSGTGIDELLEAVERRYQDQVTEEQDGPQRRLRLRRALLNLVREEIRDATGRAFTEGFLPDGGSVESALDQIINGTDNPFKIARKSVRNAVPQKVGPGNK